MTARFVLQEHHATRLHFDLRLEIDGVAKSWAVPKGISMKPGEPRLAIAVPDHSLKSMKFEGTRRAGLYGAGEVCIWDKGEFEIDSDIHEALGKGWLVFTLYGQKLRGKFRLEKWIKNDTNWSIKKLNDEYADPDFELETILKPRQHKGFFPLFESLDC